MPIHKISSIFRVLFAEIVIINIQVETLYKVAEMSDSIPVKQFADDDLIQCGICHIDIEHPRSLLYLHTYCLRCLREWNKNRKDEVICPLCREPTPLPANGVDGLRSNFFVTKLKDRKALSRQLMDKDVKIMCTSCDVSDGNEAVARCLECDDFLCKRCFQGHKSFRLTKNHSVYTIVELRSGEVNLIKKSRVDHCQEHPGQVLWFYCKSCDVPICRDCTVVEHPAGSHDLVKLNAATSGQREEIQKWVANCQMVKKEVDEAFKDVQQKRQNLESSCKKVYQTIDEAKRKIKESFLDNLEKDYADLKKNIDDMMSAREKSASAHEDELQMLNSRLNTALEMATQVSSEGSDCDVASAYKSLLATLMQLAKIKTPSVDLGEVTFVEEFAPKKSGSMIGRIEEKQITRKEQGRSTRKWNAEQWNAPWKMVKKFGDTGEGKLKDARGVAINQDGDVAVVDYNASRVYIYDINDWKMKIAIDTIKSLHSNPSHFISEPEEVAASQDKYVVCDRTYFPTVYDSCGNYLTQFQVETKYKEKRTLAIASNSQGQVLVGHYQANHIGVYNLNDGKLVSSFDIPFRAWYITVSSDDNKIIISAGGSAGVRVIDSNGSTIHVLRPPTDVTSAWSPHGVCTSGEGEDEEILVCNYHNTAGVYRFSLTGKYLSCVTTAVSGPRGIAFTDNGRIVVAEATCVKVFAPCT
ncbi:uncharacterized protein [Amphiura filiformis]|uniref:uncharacterized protein n=1 Tax=Amphiura filiformis TaxID=82378 RepID=UPI003B20FB67